MENTINIDALLAKALSLLEQVQALLMQPALWLQFLVIAAVFVVARWILAPLNIFGVSVWALAYRKSFPSWSVARSC